jgi:PAS domain S-box-containing protein
MRTPRRASAPAAAGGPALRVGRHADGATLLVVLAVLLPVLLLGAIAAAAWRNVWADATTEVEQAAATIAEYGQRELTLLAVAAGRIDALLRGLSDEQISAREAELHAAFKALVDEIPGTDAGYVLDRHGAVLVSANIFPVPRGATPSADRDFFLDLAADDAPAVHVSRLHVGRLDGMLFFAISRRRTGTGNTDLPPGAFDGVVNLSAFPAVLAAQLDRLRPGPDYITGLLREDGEVLARGVGLTASMRAPAGLVAAMATRPDRVRLLERSVVDGQEYLVAMRRIEGWAVYAAAGRSRAAIVATWRREVGEQLVFGIPATLALLAGALAMRRQQGRLASARDEMERRVAERTAELAENEGLLRGALEAGRVFVFSIDVATGRVERSANGNALLGLAPDERMDDVAGAMVRVHPDDQPALRAVLAGITPADPHFLIEYRWQRPDGQEVWLRSSGTGRFDAAGRTVAITGLVRDVTALAAAERARRTSEARLRAAAEGAGLGIYEIDFLRGEAWFDARAAAVAGGVLPAERWIAIGGAEWQALDAAIHPDDRAAYEAAWNAVASGDAEGWSVETRIRRPDGAWCWDWCHGVVTERDAASDRPRRLVGILQDVTERHQLEAELRQGQKLQALGELASGIAHDLNNVLQVVEGAAHGVENSAGDNPTVTRKARMLHAAVERGAAITGRLLRYSRRTETGESAFDPRALLLELREILAPALGARIEVRIEAAEDLPPVHADRAQLLTALINLATNARDAMPHGGPLTFSATAMTGDAPGPPAGLGPGPFLRLMVRDAGIGMEATTLARVTEPFFTTKPAGEGTGLGLSMAKGFAERSGGALAIASAPGQGTTVTLWLRCEDRAA